MGNIAKTTLKSIIAAAMIGGVSSTMTGCSNREVPAGHEAYVYRNPLFFGEGGYIKSVEGPGKTGMGWRIFTENIDVRPQPHTERYEIRMSDQLNVKFDVTLTAAPIRGHAQDLVERLGTDWYSKIKPDFESISRRVISQYKSENVQNFRDDIANRIWHGYTITDTNTNTSVTYDGMDKVVKDTPIMIYTVKVGNIDVPDAVDLEIEQKVAAYQRLERKATEKNIATKDAEIRLEEAKGIKNAQEEINKSLTPEYLQYEAIQAAKQLAGSENTTFYFVPTSTTGMGMPLVLNQDVNYQQQK